MVLKPKSSFLVEHSKFQGIQNFLKGGEEQNPKVRHRRTRHFHLWFINPTGFLSQ